MIPYSIKMDSSTPNIHMCLLFLIILCLKTTYSQGIHETKLLASDGANSDHFGQKVSISGDYAIIASKMDDDNGSSSGSCYIFKREEEGWTENAKIIASDGAAQDFFGESVSISGDYAIIGAHLDDDNGTASGSAYIFRREGSDWIEQAKLLASDGAAGDIFGSAVAIFGDYAIIGAPRDDHNGNSSGSAYIFERIGNDWIERIKLTASDGAPEDYFGLGVTISDDYAIVGAPGDDDNAERSGAAYIFKREDSLWIEHSKITASDGAFYDGFGASSSISDCFALIGAPGTEDVGGNSAYIFKYDSTSGEWTEYQKLVASNGRPNNDFGISVSLWDDFAVIGARGDDYFGNLSGSAYLFKLDSSSGEWIEQTRLNAKDTAPGDQFGNSVSVNRGNVIIGAYRNDENGFDAGAAYAFDIVRPFLLDTLSDQAVDEDFAAFIVADLDTIFDDLDSPTLIYSAVADGNTIATINEGALKLSSVTNFFGISQVIVTATDEQPASVSDTFIVSVRGVNDPPTPFALVSPSDGDTITSTIDPIQFVWRSSVDVDGDMLVYDINLYGDLLDTTITGIQDTSFYFDGKNTLRGNRVYDWTSFVSDKIVTVPSADRFTFRTPFPIPYLSIFQNPALNNYLHFAVNADNVVKEDLSLTINGSGVHLISNGINSWYGSYEMTSSGDIELRLIVGDTTLIRHFSIGALTISGGSGTSYDKRVSIRFFPNSINGDLFFAIFDSEAMGYLEKRMYQIGTENIRLDNPAKITFQTDDNRAIYRRNGNEWTELPTVKQNGHLTAYTDRLGEFKLGPAVVISATSRLIGNYPNPFNPETKIRFRVGTTDDQEKVQLKIYNIRGQLIRTLLEQSLSAGLYDVIWNGKDTDGNEVASGLYICQLLINRHALTKKMMLIR